MRVLVAGSRDFQYRNAIDAMLFGLVGTTGDDPELVVINGGAAGADTMAKEWALTFGDGIDVRPETYPAQWGEHHPDWCWCQRKRDYCPAAGHRRNQQMLDEGKPDLVVAFVNKPLAESKGTADMVKRAQRKGIPTYVIERLGGPPPAAPRRLIGP